MSYPNTNIPDAPYIGHCREEYEEMCRLYREDEEDYYGDLADDLWKEEQWERMMSERDNENE